MSAPYSPCGAFFPEPLGVGISLPSRACSVSTTFCFSTAFLSGMGSTFADGEPLGVPVVVRSSPSGVTFSSPLGFAVSSCDALRSAWAVASSCALASALASSTVIVFFFGAEPSA